MTPKNPPESQRIDPQAVEGLFDCPAHRLLSHPRVIAAYRGLAGHPGDTTPIPLHCSLPEIAFQMRDASCDKSGPRFVRHLAAVMASATPMPPTREGKLSWMVAVSTPAQWIKAAVLVWEERSRVTENRDKGVE